jgi:tetratricopeptide (TPR) repeat protein
MRIGFIAAFLIILAAFPGALSTAQVTSKTPPANYSVAAEHGATLAESGRCAEALPLIMKSVAHLSDKSLQKRTGIDGVRCASSLQKDEQLLDLLRILNREFPRDPYVLYVSVHAYSDLSTRTALELARAAPQSIPALKLDAEANEQQGKWDEAENDYHKILAENPKYPGIHFLLARILLSKPNPGPDFKEEAKKELQQELEIDPNNAGAEYILGELARQAGDLDSAIQHFSKATKLDANFADAYLGLGTSLVTQKNYEAAIPPLKTAVKLQPENPAGHYSLATAYARTGRKEDAEREFAVHQQMAERAGGQGAQNPQ